MEPLFPFRPHGAQRTHDPLADLQLVRGEGCYLFDNTGKKYLDFISGFSSTSFGHSHPKLVQAACEQIRTLNQVVGLSHPYREMLEAALSRLAPTNQPSKVWFATGGARAIEIAWKIAFKNRPGKVVSFDIAYHGRSFATANITDTKRLPIIHEIHHPPLPYPQCNACPFNLHRTSCNAECFDQSETWIKTNANEISAVFVEPVAAARGYYYAPSVFFQRLRKVTQENEILLIADEIQSGLGRLGAMFACQQQQWRPDLAVIGKSLGGGIVSIAAVVGNASLMDLLDQGIESETFAASPLACRLGYESIQLIASENLIARSMELGSMLRSGLQLLVETLQHQNVLSYQFDTEGPSGWIEIQSPQGVEVSAEIAFHSVRQAMRQGLLIQLSGIYRNRLVLIPPLVANQIHLEQAFAIIQSTLTNTDLL